ncbi:ABC transporter substrate-binding protein [Salinigranum rubrum]|nr:ABC transporter substrate-binding protein [Salinigranum rubrum]
MSSIHRRKFLKSASLTSIGIAGLAGCAGTSGSNDSSEGSGGSSGGSSSTDSSTDSSGGTTEPTTSSDSGVSGESISILTTYYPDASYSGVVRAKYQNYFEAVGFSDVTLDYSLELNPLQVVTSDDYDFVIASHLDSIAGRAQGVPVQSIVTTQGSTVQAYTYDADEHSFESPADFVGSTLGLQNDPDITTFNNEILSSELSDAERDQINETFVGYDVRNLLTGKVDAMTKFPTNADGIILELKEEANFGYIPMKDYLEVPGNAAITTTSMIENKPEVVREFVRAHAKGLADSIDPDMRDSVAADCVQSTEDAGISEQIFGTDVDAVDIQSRAVEMFREYRHIDEWDTNGVGWNPTDRVALAQQLFADAGQLDDTSDPETIVNNRFIEEVTDDQGQLIWEE